MSKVVNREDNRKDKLAYMGTLYTYSPSEQRETFGNAIKFYLGKKYWDKTFDDLELRKPYGRKGLHNHPNLVDIFKGFSELQTNDFVNALHGGFHIDLLKDIIYFNRSYSSNNFKRRVQKKHINRIKKEYRSVMRAIAIERHDVDLRPDKGIDYFTESIKKKFIDNG